MGSPAPTLRLSRALARKLDAWARAALPSEACGLLVGRRVGAVTTVHEVLRLTNVASGAREDLFELDPLEHLAAEEAAERAGLEIVGAWHSHPDSGAVPSPTDRARAWPGWSYPIVGFAAHEHRELRSWRFADGEPPREESLDTSSEALATPTLDLPPRFTDQGPLPTTDASTEGRSFALR